MCRPDSPCKVTFCQLHRLNLHRETASYGVYHVRLELFDGLTLSCAASYGRDFSPVATLFRLMNDYAQVHSPPPLLESFRQLFLTASSLLYAPSSHGQTPT